MLLISQQYGLADRFEDVWSTETCFALHSAAKAAVDRGPGVMRMYSI